MIINNNLKNYYSMSSKQNNGFKTKPLKSDSVSFSGHVNFEKVGGALKVLRHETAFFREPQTDEFVVNYIKKHFGHKNKINIVCGACSTGEEAVSMSMNLDALKDKVNILAFDLSEKSIESAKSRHFLFKNPKNNPSYIPMLGVSGFKDAYLVFDSVKPKTKEQVAKKELFDKFFEHTNIECKEDKLSLMDRFSIWLYKKMFKFEPLQYESKICKLKDGMANNIDYVVANVDDIEKLTSKEKADVITFSNALYHLVTEESGGGIRVPIDNPKQVIEPIVKKFRNSLNDGGIVRFGENECMQMYDTTTVAELMKKYGFEGLNKTEEHAENVWRKLKD